MKKYLSIMVLAVLCGAVLAYYFINKNSEEEKIVMVESYKVNFFQLGIFSDYNNALNFSESNQGIIAEDNGYYTVYSAIYSDPELVLNLKNYYEKHNIDYIVKENIITRDFYEELIEFETLLKRTDSIDVIFKTNELILEDYVISLGK